MNIGKASSIGSKTVLMFAINSMLGSISGIISILCFQRFFKEETFQEAFPDTIRLGCSSETSFLTKLPNGTIVCSDDPVDKLNTLFTVTHIANPLTMEAVDTESDTSMSDTLYHGVFEQFVPSNIMEAFVDSNFASVVIFAILFAGATAQAIKRTKDTSVWPVLDLLRQLEDIFLIMISWVISITPLAVLSLIIKAIGSQSELPELFTNVSFLVVTIFSAVALHFLVVHCGLFYVITRTNPFGFLRHIVPAQTMALACASSAASIPMMLKSLKDSDRVPESVSRFVIPFGVTFNMEGNAIYVPCASIWLAHLNGIEPEISSYILLVVLSTIGSCGATSVPGAGLILLITSYNTVFGGTGIPEGFSFLLATDWLLDRLRTVLNVTGDTFVAGMVSSMCNGRLEEVDDDDMSRTSLISWQSQEEWAVGSNDKYDDIYVSDLDDSGDEASQGTYCA